jgi:glutamate 5-kinase
MTGSLLANARRIIVKVGSSLVTNDGRGLDHTAISNWAAEIAALRQQGREVILVSSGAVAEGMQRLGWKTRPEAEHELRAAAATGQMGLVQVYEKAFSAHQIHTAQILLTHEDLADRKRYLNARSTLLTLLHLGVVPIINENDAIAVDEIRVGDNDTLGALVANLVDADALVLLTDQSGLFTADPRRDPSATLVATGRADDPQWEAVAGGTGSNFSRGGMLTKILAARRAAKSGAGTIIASGREPKVLTRLAANEAIGTHLYADNTPLAKRKTWLADHVRVQGSLSLDAGATRALLEAGKSLLPVGVTAVSGEFERGSVVEIRDNEGRALARGLVNYGAHDARRILGKPSSQIAAILGYVDEAELVHRDNLVLV